MIFTAIDAESNIVGSETEIPLAGIIRFRIRLVEIVIDL